MSFYTFMQLLDKQLILVFLCSILNFIYNKFLIFIILNINDESLFFIKSLIRLPNNSNRLSDDLSDLSDLDSESDISNSSDESDNSDSFESINKIQSIEDYNKQLQLLEYNIILKLFNIPNILVNFVHNKELINKSIDNYNDNNTYKDLINNNCNSNNKYNNSDSIYIIECFLFNIKLNKKYMMYNDINDINNDINNINHNLDFNSIKNDIKIQNIKNLKKKIVLIYYLYNKLNSNTINNLFPEHKYLYILYKKCNNNKYDYILIDLEKNYNLIKNKKLLFNKINL